MKRMIKRFTQSDTIPDNARFLHSEEIAVKILTIVDLYKVNGEVREQRVELKQKQTFHFYEVDIE